MKRQALRQLIPFAILTALMCPVMADKAPAANANAQAAPARVLDTEGVSVFEVRNYRMGPGRTQMFLVMAEQDAVVRLVIDNTTTDFATTGTVVLFAPGTGAEAIGKWINNQYSCGLYMDVPEPVFTGKLPDDGYTITEARKVGERAGHIDNATYHDYRMNLAVNAHEKAGKYTLKAFDVEAKVFLKVGN